MLNIFKTDMNVVPTRDILCFIGLMLTTEMFNFNVLLWTKWINFDTFHLWVED